MPPRKPTKKQINKIKIRADFLCEYCLSQAAFSSQPFAIEHIVPFILGGKTVLGNLAFACQGCNGHKFTHLAGHDPITRKHTALFHPRKQKWREHFTWNEDFTIIIGKTPTGRATVETLQLNREGCINLRKALFAYGKHPPKKDFD